MECYSVTEKRILRNGYTTGSCAAAAAKAAAMLLFTGEPVENVSIDLPGGTCLELSIEESFMCGDTALAVVIKDSGDDPDITHGIRIQANAAVNLEHSSVVIRGGKGVGRVTRKGLSVQTGQAAINPVPLKMITNEVSKVKPEDAGVEIEISVPDGEKIAKKTMNPRLGIEGGISILGTTGIVKPMSEEAFQSTIAAELSMRKAEGYRCLVLTPGNYGERFVNDIPGIDRQAVVNISNFIGFALERCVHLQFDSILLAGHIGKLIKVAGGNFHTHNRISDSRLEIFASHYALFTDRIGDVRSILLSNTTEEAVSIADYPDFYRYLAGRIKARALDYINRQFKVEALIFSQEKGLLGSTLSAEERQIWINQCRRSDDEQN